jgi:hypothetical protein
MNFVLTRFHLNLLESLYENANLFCPDNLKGFNLLLKDARASEEKGMFWEKYQALKLFVAEKADCLKFDTVKKIPSELLEKTNILDISIILSFKKNCNLLVNKRFADTEKMKSFIETYFSNYVTMEKQGDLIYIGIMPSIVTISRDEGTLASWRSKF